MTALHSSTWYVWYGLLWSVGGSDTNEIYSFTAVQFGQGRQYEGWCSWNANVRHLCEPGEPLLQSDDWFTVSFLLRWRLSTTIAEVVQVKAQCTYHTVWLVHILHALGMVCGVSMWSVIESSLIRRQQLMWAKSDWVSQLNMKYLVEQYHCFSRVILKSAIVRSLPFVAHLPEIEQHGAFTIKLEPSQWKNLCDTVS